MSLIYKGNDDFDSSAAPEWNQQIFDLDTLTEKYSGGREKLDAFLDGLVRFQPSAIDSNMFLVNWFVSGGTRAFPEVSLIFNGKKNGILPFGRRSTETKTQTTSAQTPFGNISITYRTRTPIYEWISTGEGEGGVAVPNDVTSSPSTTYVLFGTVFVGNGSDLAFGQGTSFTTQVRVGDVIVLIVHDPTIPITNTTPVPIAVYIKVAEVISDSQLRLTQTVGGYPGLYNYAPSTTSKPTAIGYHVGDLPITVVNVRYGCGITPISGALEDLIGPILVATYFFAIVTPDLSASEVVPDKYWKNRQELVTSLIALPC